MPRVGVREKPSSFAGAAVGLALVRPPAEQLWLFDCELDLDGLRMERAAMAERRREANTRSAYAWDWLDFTRWCAAAGVKSLPASGDTLSLYLVGLARRGRALSTIRWRVSSISAAHLAAGLASPASAEVGEVLAGLARRLGTAPRHAKAALSIEDLRRVLAAIDDDGPRGCRDRAILVVGFASSLRRSDLVRLDLADVSVKREGLVLRIWRSKADQAGIPPRKLHLALARVAGVTTLQLHAAQVLLSGSAAFHELSAAFPLVVAVAVEVLAESPALLVARTR